MDAMGCRRVLCSSCDGGVPHRLATLGNRYPGHRYADRAVSFYERGVVVAALVLASIGWKRPTLSLIIRRDSGQRHLPSTSCQLSSKDLCHRAFIPLRCSTCPSLSWAFVGAWRDGVPRRAMVCCFSVGTLMMTAVVLTALVDPLRMWGIRYYRWWRGSGWQPPQRNLKRINTLLKWPP